MNEFAQTYGKMKYSDVDDDKWIQERKKRYPRMLNDEQVSKLISYFEYLVKNMEGEIALLI